MAAQRQVNQIPSLIFFYWHSALEFRCLFFINAVSVSGNPGLCSGSRLLFVHPPVPGSDAASILSLPLSPKSNSLEMSIMPRYLSLTGYRESDLNVFLVIIFSRQNLSQCWPFRGCCLAAQKAMVSPSLWC
jgi:hypothetical protein